MALPTAAQRRAQRRLAGAIAGLGFVLPGSLVQRRTTCGSSTCRCRADPPQLHGPYLTWTRKVAGRTVSRRLSDEQLALYGPWFENARRLRKLVAELETLSLGIVEHELRSADHPAGLTTSRRRKTPPT